MASLTLSPTPHTVTPVQALFTASPGKHSPPVQGLSLISYTKTLKVTNQVQTLTSHPHPHSHSLTDPPLPLWRSTNLVVVAIFVTEEPVIVRSERDLVV